MSDGKVALVEIFASPQGEGYHSGRWAVFVRLAGCNLACEFAPGAVCDTPYMRANEKLTVGELFTRVRGLIGSEHNPMVIFTGGEPTLHPLFDLLVEKAKQLKYYVAVETNGTTWKDGLQWVDWLSVSPKDSVPQTSSASYHNPHPQSSKLSGYVEREMEARGVGKTGAAGEYRYVITAESATPPYLVAPRHYVSPAVNTNSYVVDDHCMECGTTFPGFAPGAVERCLQIVEEDPRWRLSIQTHKVLGVR